MTRLSTIFTTLYALYSLPLISAWTFVWRNASNNPTVEKGTGAQSCKTIDHAKGKTFEFDAEDSLVRIYMYQTPNCTDDNIGIAEDYFAKNSTSPLRAFAVIDLRGANTSTGGELTPFPGADWFKSSPTSPIVTAMGERLVAEDCGKYSVGPGPQWSEVDRESYRCWQEKLGYTGTDADGWPGKTTWDQLKVPLPGENDEGTSKTTEMPSSTSTSTRTPTSTSTGTVTPTSTLAPDTDISSGSTLGGGKIAGIVVGSLAGLGLVGAIVYFWRRTSRSSAPESTELVSEPGPEGGAVAGGELKRSLREKLPAEVEADPAKIQKKYVTELPGDSAAAELSDSRRILELGDSR